MSDFLDRMASRSQGTASVLRPRPLSMYEGGPDLFEEVHEEREAAPASPSAPARAARRAAEPGPDRPPAGALPDRIPEPWTEEARALARAQRSPVSSPPPPGPDEAVRNPFSAPLGEAPAPAPGAAPRAAPPMSAATVRRRTAEAEADPADLGRAAPLAGSSEAPRVDPDLDELESATMRASAPVRSEVVTRRSDPGAARIAPDSPLPADAPESAPASARGEAAAELALASERAETRESGLRSVPARAVPPAESAAPTADSTRSDVRPFAPRAESAPGSAPVEIRIGRIDIHAAPPAAPAAPVEAPGPSLDAFLARPRR